MQDLRIAWPGGEQTFTPADSPVLIGRSADADVVLTEPAISRRHLEFVRLGGSWIANDASTHGTYAVGVRMAPSWTVAEARTLRLGGTAGVEVIVGLIDAEDAAHEGAGGAPAPPRTPASSSSTRGPGGARTVTPSNDATGMVPVVPQTPAARTAVPAPVGGPPSDTVVLRTSDTDLPSGRAPMGTPDSGPSGTVVLTPAGPPAGRQVPAAPQSPLAPTAPPAPEPPTPSTPSADEPATEQLATPDEPSADEPATEQLATPDEPSADEPATEQLATPDEVAGAKVDSPAPPTRPDRDEAPGDRAPSIGSLLAEAGGPPSPGPPSGANPAPPLQPPASAEPVRAVPEPPGPGPRSVPDPTADEVHPTTPGSEPAAETEIVAAPQQPTVEHEIEVETQLIAPADKVETDVEAGVEPTADQPTVEHEIGIEGEAEAEGEGEAEVETQLIAPADEVEVEAETQLIAPVDTAAEPGRPHDVEASVEPTPGNGIDVESEVETEDEIDVESEAESEAEDEVESEVESEVEVEVDYGVAGSPLAPTDTMLLGSPGPATNGTAAPTSDTVSLGFHRPAPEPEAPPAPSAFPEAPGTGGPPAPPDPTPPEHIAAADALAPDPPTPTAPPPVEAPLVDAPSVFDRTHVIGAEGAASPASPPLPPPSTSAPAIPPMPPGGPARPAAAPPPTPVRPDPGVVHETPPPGSDPAPYQSRRITPSPARPPAEASETIISDNSLQLSVDGRDYTFLPGVVVTVGRDPSCLVQLEERHSLVSRRHLEIEHRDGDWWINDISSKGTYIDGRRVSGVYKAEGAFLTQLGDDDAGTPMRVITAGEHRAPRSFNVALVVALAALVVAAVVALWFVVGGGDGQATPVATDATVPATAAPAVTPSDMSAADLARAKQATVLLLAEQGFGSGFFVTENLILTNQHVAVLDENLSVAVSRTVDDAAQVEFAAETVANHPFLDIAVLRLTIDRNGNPVTDSGLEPVPIGDSNSLVLGDEVLNTGFAFDLSPAGLDDMGDLLLPAVSTTSGEAANFSIWPGCSNPTQAEFLPIDAPEGVRCSPDGDLTRAVVISTFSSGQGASGSPVFKGGEVVAVVFSGPEGNENAGRNIATNAFADWLDDVIADNS